MAPSHILRHQARVFAARAGTAVAVFFAIAIVLLAGGSSTPLSSAEATTGRPGPAGAATTPVEEPVLGGDDGLPPAGEPATPPADVPPATDQPPAADEPPATEEPPPRRDGGAARHGRRGRARRRPAHRRAGRRVHGDDPTSGGDKGEGDTTDPEEPPVDNGSEDATPESGGSKGDDPADEPDVEEPAPDPNSMPGVMLPPADTGPEPGAGSTPTPTPDGEGVTPALGDGRVTDPGEPGGAKRTDSAKFGVAAGNNGGTSATGGAGAGTATIPAGTQLAALQAGDGQPTGGGGGQGEGNGGNGDDGGAKADENNNPVTNTVERLVEVVPDELKAALAALAALSVMLGVGYLLAALRARRLARQRRELLQEVGLLQTALLPPVPDKVGALLTSVAYRPADGPGAGGDFYDVLPLTRRSRRLHPRRRLRPRPRCARPHRLHALHAARVPRGRARAARRAPGRRPRDRRQPGRRLRHRAAGRARSRHRARSPTPAPGTRRRSSSARSRTTRSPRRSSPPIGVGVRTGLRQTTVPLVPGAVAALFTDGLMEARTPDGILGRERLTELLERDRR